MVVLAQAAALFTMPGLAIAGAAAVSIPIAIHLLSRTRRRSERWGAMRFLLAAYRQHKRRLRLEQWLLLAVRCAILAVLGLALSGPLVAGLTDWLGGGGASGRVVELVLDDSLSTQARAGAGSDRFARLKAAALSVVSALGPQDRVGLWRAGRPVAGVVGEATADHHEVAARIKAMRPGYGASNLPAALVQVARRLKQARVGSDQAVVVVLSDFPRAGAYLDHPMSAPAAALGKLAKVVVAKPASGRANVQLAAMSPRRTMVLSQADGQVRVPVQLTIVRFGDSASQGTGALSLKLLSESGKVLAQTRRPLHWASGQSSQSYNLALSGTLAQTALAADRVGLIIQGTVASEDGADAVAADDRRWATVTVRRQLRVAVAAGSTSRNDKGLTAGQWMTLALAPGAGRVHVVQLSSDELTAGNLAGLDAVVAVRPDLLDHKNWQALGAFARAGGLVWVTVPRAGGVAQWVKPMQQAFALDWRVGLEPIVSGQDDQGVGLDGRLSVPKALSLLSADWQQLLAPVRVTRRLPLAVGSSDCWLGLAHDGGKSGRCVLAGRRIGAGELVFLATALGPAWTNLETKPLFVPLVHEILRGVLGRRQRGQASATAGRVIQLGPGWGPINELVPAKWVKVAGARSVSKAGRIELQSTKGAVRSSAAVREPGVYQGSGRQHWRQVAVNVDAKAGDTRGVSQQQVGRWLDGLGVGRWSYLDWSDPGAAVQQTIKRVNLGWPLLWVVLALVILETILARRFSHAKRLEQGSLLGRAGRVLRGLGPGARAAASERAA